MKQMDRIAEIAEYIDDFDNKNVNVCFLFHIGSSGSALLQSLLDNHEEILTMPFSFNYYLDWYWRNYDNLLKDHNKLVDDLFSLSNLVMDNSSSYIEGHSFGINKDEHLVLKKEEIITILKEVLNNIKEVNRKNILLALYLTYAKVFGVDLSKIKSIFHHEHALVTYKPVKKYIIDELFNEDYLYEAHSEQRYPVIKKDFPDAKFIVTIRDPFDTFNTIAKRIFDLYYFWGTGISLNINVISFHCAMLQKRVSGDNYKFIKFEDIHKNLEQTMQDVASFLNVKYTNTMLESTLQGKLWWYEGKRNGINPDLCLNSWKDTLDNKSKFLGIQLMNPIAEKFGYERCEESIKGNIFEFLDVEKMLYKKTYENLVKNKGKQFELYQYLEHQSDLEYHEYLVFKLYPYYRAKMVLYYNFLGQLLDKFDSCADYADYWLQKGLQ